MHARLQEQEERLRSMRTLLEARDTDFRALAEKLERCDWDSQMSSLKQSHQEEKQQRSDDHHQAHLAVQRLEHQVEDLRKDCDHILKDMIVDDVQLDDEPALLQTSLRDGLNRESEPLATAHQLKELAYHVTRLEDHVRHVESTMATNAVSSGSRGDGVEPRVAELVAKLAEFVPLVKNHQEALDELQMARGEDVKSFVQKLAKVASGMQELKSYAEERFAKLESGHADVQQTVHSKHSQLQEQLRADSSRFAASLKSEASLKSPSSPEIEAKLSSFHDNFDMKKKELEKQISDMDSKLTDVDRYSNERHKTQQEEARLVHDRLERRLEELHGKVASPKSKGSESDTEKQLKELAHALQHDEADEHVAYKRVVTRLDEMAERVKDVVNAISSSDMRNGGVTKVDFERKIDVIERQMKEMGNKIERALPA